MRIGDQWTARRGSYGVLSALAATALFALAMGAGAIGWSGWVVPLVGLSVGVICLAAVVLGGLLSAMLLMLGVWFPVLAQWGAGLDQWLDEAP